MNGSYFQNPNFSNNDFTNPTVNSMEESYIENILRLNRGKEVKVFAAFPDSNDYRDRIYKGIIKAAGKDHLIMSSTETGDWYLIPLIYVDWVEFEEKINYFEELQ